MKKTLFAALALALCLSSAQAGGVDPLVIDTTTSGSKIWSGNQVIKLPTTAADEARKIDFTAALVGIDGKPLVVEKDTPPLTLGDVAASALTATFKDENPSGQDKVKRWALALRVHSAKDAELTADDVKTIKDLIGKAYGPMIVGQSWAILDPASVK